MLVRLEVDGFKNMLGLQVEFGPFTCIAGPNGTGKSNLFDAMRFLSLLADHSLMDAAQLVRSIDGRGGDPRELFWTDGEERASTMTLAAEIIVLPEIEDDFGRPTKPTITFLRYELELGYEPPSGMASLGRLVLKREDLRHINVSDAHKHMRFPHSAGRFRKRIVTGRRSGKAFISTKQRDDGTVAIQVHQDGGSRGQPRPSPAHTAPRTIISTTTTSSDPTILAARREFQSWRALALEPAAMRSPDPFSAAPGVGENGSHLAATLYRLASAAEAEGGGESAEDVYARVASRAAELIDVQSVRVDRDDRRELLTLELREPRGDYLPARSLSDGTLRFLALCLIDVDPETVGVICMEEPENGIHPAKMESMVDLVRDLAVDPTEEPSSDNPLRQVIVNTHSPHFVQLQEQSDLLFAETATVRTESGRTVSTLRLRPMHGTWRCTDEEHGVGVGSVLAFLTAPPGAQLEIPTGLMAS